MHTYNESIYYLAHKIDLDYITVSSWLIESRLANNNKQIVQELAASFNLDPKIVLEDMNEIIISRLFYEKREK